MRILYFIIILLVCNVSYADKITNYDFGVPVQSDVTVYVSDPEGTPVTKKTLISSITQNAGGWTDGGTNVYQSLTTDTVGIGTTTSAAKLSIVQNEDGDFLRMSSFGTSAGDKFTVDSNGNVGIGNQAPLVALSVNGDVRLETHDCSGGVNGGKLTTDLDGNIICDDDTSDTNSFVPSNETNLTWGTGTSFTHTFDSGATDPAITYSSGAIATANASLTINGTTSQVKYANNIFLNGDTARKLMLGSTGGTYNETLYIDNDTTSNTIGVSTDSGVTLVDFDTIGLKSTGMTSTTTVTVGTSGTAVNTLGSAGNVSIGTAYVIAKVAPTNGAIIQGNVGIGTFDPTTTLHVQGNVRATGLVSCDTINTDINGVLSCGTDATGGGGGVGVGTINASSTVNVFPYYAATGSTLSSQGTLYLVGSNIGVGTSTAGARLTVSGSASVSATVTANAFVGDGSGLTNLAGSSSGGFSDGGANVYNTTTTDMVGIGTTTPSGTLEIVKQTSTSPLMVSSVATGDGDYLIVHSSGRVGIGTTVPGQGLDINGTVRVRGTSAQYFGSDNSAYVVASATTANGIDIYTNTTKRMGISANGLTGFGTAVNVGLGTFAPNAKLSIVGNGTTTGQALAIRDSAGTFKNAFLDNGNVGLGTTIPPEVLYVVGNATATGYVQGLGSGVSYTSGNLGIGTITAGAILAIPSIKSTTGTRYLCIDTTGNVASSATACSGT